MLSLPLIEPQGAPSLREPFRPRPESPPLSPPSSQHPSSAPHHSALNRQQQQRRDEERKAHNARSPLALLTADEAAIAQRKAAIRDFGAFWIRPPGVGKTLQAMREEEQERLEQEEADRQQMNLRDMQALQEQEDARHRAAEAAAASAANEGAETERDLDDDIPDAEDTGELSFNEDSMMEGSQLAIEEDEQEQEQAEIQAEMEAAELTGATRDEEDLGMDRDLDQDLDQERNLDDSIPEAGSYQHTDTELEDSSSDVDESEPTGSPVRRPTRMMGRGMAGGRRSSTSNIGSSSARMSLGGERLQTRMRAHVAAAADSLPRSPGSLDLSSSLLDSSLMVSSPMGPRANRAGRGGGRLPAAARRRRAEGSPN